PVSRVALARQGKPLARQLTAPGSARLFLDGTPLLAIGEGPLPTAFPGQRSDSIVVRFAGPVHVLAVRHDYPSSAPRPAGGIGFHLTLSNGSERPPPLP